MSAADVSSTPVKVAVIGTGLIGKKHLSLLDNNPKFQVVATVSPSPLPSDLDYLRGATHFSSTTALIEQCAFDAAIVASPNETHADNAVAIIEAGIPVLVEKPLAGTLEDAMRIIKAADACDVPVLMGHHRRYNPVIPEMTALVRSGDMGQLVAFSGVWSVYKPDPYFQTKWRTGPTGGPIMINLIHEIDSLQAMLGPIATVSSMQAPKRRPHSSEESLAVLFGFESGVIGSVVISDSAASPWSWEQATGENDPVFPMNHLNTYRFMFERGGVEFPELKTWKQHEPDWTGPFDVSTRNKLQAPMRSVFSDQIDHFYDVARRSADPIVTARDGLMALKVALAVRQTMENGPGVVSLADA